MSFQVNGPGGETYYVADDLSVFDANNNTIGHVDQSQGAFVDGQGNTTSLTDLAGAGFVCPDGFSLDARPELALLAVYPDAPDSGLLVDDGTGGVGSTGSTGATTSGVEDTDAAAFAERIETLTAFTALADDPKTTTLDAREFMRELLVSTPSGLVDVSATEQLIADMLATHPELAASVEELGTSHLRDDARPLAEVMASLSPAHRLIAECAYLDICSGGGSAEYLRGLTGFAGEQVFSSPDFPGEANERGYAVGYVVHTDAPAGALSAIERADSMDGVAELGASNIVGHVGGPTDGHAVLLNIDSSVSTIVYVTPEDWPAEKVQIFQRAYQQIYDNNTNYTQTIGLNFALQGLASEGVTGAQLADYMTAQGYALPPGGVAELDAVLANPRLFSFDAYGTGDSPQALFQLCGRSLASNEYELSAGEPPLGFGNEAHWYTREVGCSPALAQALAIADRYSTWEAYTAAFSGDTPPLSDEEVARLDNYSPMDILIMGARGGEFLASEVVGQPNGLVLGDNTQFYADSFDDHGAATERETNVAIADWLLRAGGFSEFAFGVMAQGSANSDAGGETTAATRNDELLEWRARSTAEAMAQAGMNVSVETLRALFACMERAPPGP